MEKRPRRRKQETVRERAAKQAAREASPGKMSKVKSLAGLKLSQTGRWLNQSLATHPVSASGQSRFWQAWTRPRSMIPRYVRLSWYELRLVQWPRFRQAMRLTFAVFVFAAIFVFLVSTLDWMLTKIFEEVILNELSNVKEFFEGIF